MFHARLRVFWEATRISQVFHPAHTLLCVIGSISYQEHRYPAR